MAAYDIVRGRDALVNKLANRTSSSSSSINSITIVARRLARDLVTLDYRARLIPTLVTRVSPIQR